MFRCAIDRGFGIIPKSKIVGSTFHQRAGFDPTLPELEILLVLSRTVCAPVPILIDRVDREGGR